MKNHSPRTINAMEDQKYCKVCLATEIKMHRMSLSSIGEAYSQLLQISDITMQQYYACYECASLLQKFYEFYIKCKTAHKLLTCIQPDHSKIIKKSVQQINRKLYNLESRLSQSEIKTYDNQVQLLEDGFESDKKILLDEIKLEEKLPDIFVDVEVKRNTQNLSIDHSTKEILATNSIFINNTSIEHISNKKRKHVKDTKTKSTKVVKKRLKTTDDNISIKEEDSLDRGFSDTDDDEILATFSKLTSRAKIRDNKIKNLQKSEKTDSKPVKKKSGPKIDESFFIDHATVIFLTPEDARKEVLLRKESSNYKNCAFKCDYCYRGYEMKRTFENHMKKHSSEFGPFECEYCHLRFPTQRFLKQHNLTCHTRKYECKKCPFTCFSKNQAKKHVSFHKGTKYPCEECGKVFSMPNTLLMHKRMKHSTECPCDLCGSMFGTQRGLSTHKTLLHKQDKNEEKGPKCEECGVQFASENAWKRHLVLSSSHKTKISNGCETCGESFTDRESLKNHLKLHSRNRPTNENSVTKFPSNCNICSTLLTNRKAYKSHMMSQHPTTKVAKKIAEDQTRCVCEVCGKNFKKQYFLKYHKRIHTGERPHQCKECGKSFTFPGALSEHMNTHTKSRVYQCHMCEKGFANRGALVKHVNAHLGIRPHKCPICDKAFPNPCHVKTHMKYVHYKEPWPKRDRSKRSAKI